MGETRKEEKEREEVASERDEWIKKMGQKEETGEMGKKEESYAMGY